MGFLPWIWPVLLIFGLFVGSTVDIFHTFQTRTYLQGAADASALAGALQNHQEILERDPYGAPIRYGWYLNRDAGPESEAMEAWNANAENFPNNIGQGVTPLLSRTTDNKGMNVQVQQTVKQTVMENVVNNFFGSGSAPDTSVPVPVFSQARLQ